MPKPDRLARANDLRSHVYIEARRLEFSIRYANPRYAFWAHSEDGKLPLLVASIVAECERRLIRERTQRAR